MSVQDSDSPRRRASSILVGMALAFGACATAGPKPPRVWSESHEPVLLAHGGAFELHIRNGKVEQIIPASTPGGLTRVRVVDDIGELRQLYVDAVGTPLPEGGEGMPLEVNGWVGLECVRAGQACGPAPADAPRAMIVVRFD